MSGLEVNAAGFTLDGKPFRLLSGAIHYFRVHPAQWADRIAKARAMGLNTIETYVPWNRHEPAPGQFDFAGGLDLAAFIHLVEQQGLKLLLRPGPYICAEWEFGGFPAWLLADPEMSLRCRHPAYLQAVGRYFDALLPQVTPLLASQGGPILAVQVENEYGSYGSDTEYLRFLEQALRDRGVDVPLFTSDGPTERMLLHGTLPGVLKTVNFGSGAPEAFALLKQHQPDALPICMEFWNGWFDHWGGPHHIRNAADAAKSLDDILSVGGGVNFYMLHGGSSFGFMNGANCHQPGQYQPTISSYDYDAPISEAGDLTPKYHALREVIGKYTELPPLPDFPVRRATVSRVELQDSATLWNALDRLSQPVKTATPQHMEALGQAYGYLLYRGEFRHPAGETKLIAEQVHDRAAVFLNGKKMGVLERNGPTELSITLPDRPFTLELLVENQGRVNYGPYLIDRKGILGSIRLGETILHGWTHFPLALSDLSGLPWGEAQPQSGPAFYRLTFEVSELGDTFLHLPGWTKGNVWVGGFHLGRYWKIGPTQSLYVPEPILRLGANELIVFEEEQPSQTPEFRNEPDLGPAHDTAKKEQA